MNLARCVVYGAPGAGKSTFGASAPNPIFILGEDGVRHLDVARFPLVTSWTELVSCIDQLTAEEHSFGTVVLDTLDALEPYVQDAAYQRVKHLHKEASRYSEIGYGKGPAYALETWNDFLRRLDRLQAKRGMHIILLAHAAIRMRKEPLVADYERHTLKLEEKSGSTAVFQWADEVLFATSFDGISRDGRQTHLGERVLLCERAPGADVKNRRSLPREIPLSWDAYMAPHPSRDELISRLLEITPEDSKEKARQWAINKSVEEIKRMIERKSK